MKKLFQSILCFSISFICIIQFNLYANEFDKFHFGYCAGALLFAIVGLWLFFTKINKEDK